LRSVNCRRVGRSCLAVEPLRQTSICELLRDTKATQ
jgi:hypothetical protein